jgi:hypothetical protein
MKKTITTLVIILSVLVANAQFKSRNGISTNSVTSFIPVIQSHSKAAGDTLMYCDGKLIFINPTDQPAFFWNMEDNDSLLVDPVMASDGWNSGWMNIYDNTSTGCTPDTCWWFGATSRFNPAGQADNWIEFGPITISGLCELRWDYQAPDPANSDGYKVWISTSGMNIDDFLSGTNIFTRIDNQNPTAPDTVFNHKVVSLLNWLGMPVYIGFQHNANDKYIIYLDNFAILDLGYPGINENTGNTTVFNNLPNPAKESTMINYQLNSNADVTIQVIDMTGRLVSSNVLGQQDAGIHHFTLNTSDFANGVYFYSINTNNSKVVKKMIVQK